MHELIQSEIQSDVISEKKFVTSGGSVPFPFREIYPTGMVVYYIVYMQFSIRKVKPGVALWPANMAVLSEPLPASTCFSPYRGPYIYIYARIYAYRGIFLMLTILCITSLLA